MNKKADHNPLNNGPAKQSDAMLGYCSVNLSLDDTTLHALLTPKDSYKAITAESLKELITTEGYGQFYIDENAFTAVIANADNNEPVEITLGEKRNAKVSVSVTADDMQAFLSITPEMGGRPLDSNYLLTLISEQKIIASCIDHQVLTGCLAHYYKGIIIEQQLFAAGIKPIKGESSQFIPLFQTDDVSSPKVNENGLIDYFATHEYIVVNAGDPLMRKTNPIEGKQGLNVMGGVLPAAPGDHLNFDLNESVFVSEQDENLLLAAIKGHPIVEACGVHVDETLHLKNVDLESGNVYFDGSVAVSGDVSSQLKIEASGDVYIKGFVERAMIKAGNEIVIGGGVISGSTSTSGTSATTTTYLEAGTNIRALFFNQTIARAAKEISAQQYAINCDFNAGEKILVGEKGGKGVVVGGQLKARLCMEVNIAGSSAYVKTELCCAPIEQYLRAQKKLLKEQLRRNTEKDQLAKILEKIKMQGSPDTIGTVVLNKARKIHSTMETLALRLDDIPVELESLETVISQAQQATIQINKTLYPDAVISINDCVYHCHDEHGKTTMSAHEGEIVFDLTANK